VAPDAPAESPSPYAAPAAGAPLDAQRRARLRWRCRRGMLENDLILTRFLDRRGDRLTESDVAALDRLLDLPDAELWDLFCGRRRADAELQPLIDEMSTP
jgi:antitoxin CptB